MKITTHAKCLAALVMLMLQVASLHAQTPYVFYCAGNKTLYFLSSVNTYTTSDSIDGQKITAIYKGNDVIKITNNPNWSRYNRQLKKAVFDSSFQTVLPTNITKWFSGCSNLEEIQGLKYLNTSEVTNMAYLFQNCSKLTNIDVTHFDTAKTTQMSGMFQNCRGIATVDVTHFNTSKVCTMMSMFEGCSKLTSVDVTGFDTSNVTHMQNMFNGCIILPAVDVTHFNTAKLQNMSYMFNGCAKLTSAGLDVSHFNTANVTTMEGVFQGCQGLTTLDVSHFNTSNVMYMARMFNGCKNLKGIDVTGFDTGNVTEMDQMFQDCEKFTSTSIDVSHFNTANVTNMNGMFLNCKGLTTLDLSNFNTAKVTSMNQMFSGCNNLTDLNVLSFNTSQVRDMQEMFYRCTSLTQLDLSNFNTANVMTMYNMFQQCKSLKSLDLNNFSLEKVNNVINMFQKCDKLKTILWDIDMTVESSGVFNGSTNLRGEYGARPSDGQDNWEYGDTTPTGYLTKNVETLTASYVDGAYWTTYYNERVGSVADDNTTVYKAVLNESERILELYNIEDKIINPGQAVILKSTEPTITLRRTLQTLEGGTGDYTYNSICGADYNITVSEYEQPTSQGTIYALNVVDGVLGFYRLREGRTIKARKAYLPIWKSSLAGIRVSFGDDEATGIHEVENEESRMKNDEVYDLTGRKHSTLHKGLYIVGGKKVFIK